MGLDETGNDDESVAVDGFAGGSLRRHVAHHVDHPVDDGDVGRRTVLRDQRAAQHEVVHSDPLLAFRERVTCDDVQKVYTEIALRHTANHVTLVFPTALHAHDPQIGAGRLVAEQAGSRMGKGTSDRRPALCDQRFPRSR